jgi:hypothetical protein
MILEKQISEVPNACNYCRELMKLPEPPKTLKLYRGDMLCLTVDVEGASKLRIVEDNRIGLHYKKYKAEEYIALKHAVNGASEAH